MHDYEYVPKEIALPIKNDIIELIKHVRMRLGTTLLSGLILSEVQKEI